MPHFAKGVVHFQNDVYPEKKDLFEKLRAGLEWSGAQVADVKEE